MAERKKLLLRLDPQVYQAVARWAADDLRSVNAQIEYALRLALRAAGRPPRAEAPAPADAPAADPPSSDGPAPSEDGIEPPAGGEARGA
ncbi:hypothetical protein [Rhizomonospora bruguierae]|uniref:hypothetical protein n=1 Tax=Rhizomonospora bruguierae TaxID=1581705 RepID=UPI001BD01FFB|nr:hypothetical protein [Micromonospora sp. NBRC 107566]